jgi:membrane dipeptidase
MTSETDASISRCCSPVRQPDYGTAESQLGHYASRTRPSSLGPCPLMLPVVDLHQDLLPHAEARHIYGDMWQTSLAQLDASAVRVVVASTWPGDRAGGTLSSEALKANEYYMHRYTAVARDSPGWGVVLTAEDLELALEGPTRGLVIHVEGMPRFETHVEEVLQRWFDLGCRSVGVMWNKANGLGFGPGDARGGLTQRGKKAVQWLDRNPLVLDTAHMSETTFWDTLSATSGPAIASHANARALWNHPRNLTDDQLRAIADRDGVIGVAFTSLFLGEDGTSGAARVVDHIEHIAAVAGGAHVAVGSDLGGINAGALPDLASVKQLGLLFDEMSARGLSRDLVAAVANANATRVLVASLAKRPS